MGWYSSTNPLFHSYFYVQKNGRGQFNLFIRQLNLLSK
ncbi:hypothetical protein GAGA_0576 [Paraglaciecola agarilytica NO2]|uniref:Uncharacterized protein n=1 Tax=Paraglaciecola agarilytica NO2 TaxID=1125747 RepID=A0ABQ0I298_9ALTE|nr:hypothetical protein GAGA_0576 [Paraglaciecola agarilytica NO2]